MEKSRLVQITRQSKIMQTDFAPLMNAIYEQIWCNLYPPQILTDDLTSRVAKNVITPENEPIPDCQTCGACCAALPMVAVRRDEKVSAADVWNIVIENGETEAIVDRFVRRTDENFACVALEGEIGEQVGCRIYENRPRTCRTFEAGSDRCHALRRAYGIEPFLSLEEMMKAIQKLDEQPEIIIEAETIRNVKFEFTESGNVQIKVLTHNDEIKIIHEFNPQNETWRQFEFENLTLAQAAELIASPTEERASLY